MRGCVPRLAGSLAVVLACACAGAQLAIGVEPSARARVARANSPAAPRAPAGAPRAPAGPPLTQSPGAPAGEEPLDGAPRGEVDPLVSNGLGSPSCGPAGVGELSAADRGHCETSGFAAAGAPTGDFGIDVHIDTGLIGLSNGGLLSAVQDLFVAPLWMALVWAVHALVVMLEWCFRADLFTSMSGGGLSAGLGRMERAFTDPWLPLALAVASVLALYDGLIRRRVAETIGQVVLTTAMMAGGLWVILDPAGTVGALARWAEQAAIGTLATAAQGSPQQPARALGASLDTVFASAVEAPWCYLEFGDVAWCRDPGRLDPQLHVAALKLAGEEQLVARCALGPLAPCPGANSGATRSLEHSAQLLRDATSNGAVFLALPANDPARNSINDEGSLLRAICRSSTATSCRGPSASQAEFRTDSSTWSRVGGLLLIAAGALGMLLLFGWIALRLLTAAIFSFLYLLLAPAMVLAPAFGDGGRAVFRRWTGQLLGTVVAKLLYSFLLGVVLAALAAVASLTAVGWWAQWLLMSALWWGAFMRRHQVLELAEGAIGRDSSQRPATRRLSEALETRKEMAAARWRARKSDRAAPKVQQRSGGNAAATQPSAQTTDAERDRAHASEIPRAGGGPNPAEALIADARSQPTEADARIRAGDASRGDAAARRTAPGEERDEPGEPPPPTTAAGAAPAPDATRTHGEATRAAGGGAGEGAHRPAAAPAESSPRGGAAAETQSAAGHQPPMGPPVPRASRVARAEVDRELEQQRERGGPTPPTPDGGDRRVPPRRDDGEQESKPVSRAWQDIRDVEAGRKRQLGYGRD